MMTTNQIEKLNADVEAAQATVERLLKIKKLLQDELPQARSALFAAQKKLNAATRPDPASIRQHEIETLNRRIAEAKENA